MILTNHMDQQPVLTPEGYEKFVIELEHLKTVRRREIAARIEYAKSLGDLSENAEYSSAREEQAFCEGRVLELEDLMKNAIVVKHSVNATAVNVGDTVVVESGGKEWEFQIVGANEADPTQKRISNESPLGQALMGVRVGESVVVDTPRGKIVYKVKKITS